MGINIGVCVCVCVRVRVRVRVRVCIAPAAGLPGGGHPGGSEAGDGGGHLPPDGRPAGLRLLETQRRLLPFLFTLLTPSSLGRGSSELGSSPSCSPSSHPPVGAGGALSCSEASVTVEPLR